MELITRFLGITLLLTGVALPIWVVIKVLFNRGFQFKKSRLLPAIIVYGLTVILVFLFWETEKQTYNVIEFILYGSIYYVLGIVYSWLVSLKSKQWRSLLQASAMILLGVPFILYPFDDWQPVQILSLWGGVSGMFFIGYSLNSTWVKEHIFSGIIPIGSFLFIVPYFMVPSSSGTHVRSVLQITLLVIVMLSVLVQWVRSVWILNKKMLILSSFIFSILVLVCGYFLINQLPDMKWKGSSVGSGGLLLFLTLGGLSGMLTYLIGLKAKLFKNFMLFSFLQDRTFVVNIERYANLLVWGVMVWAAYFFCGMPGVFFLAIGGLGSLIVNFSIQYTNAILYSWNIAVFILFASVLGDLVGGSTIDLAHPKVILWATIGGVLVGLHLFFDEVQKLIFERRNFNIILIGILLSVVLFSMGSVKAFNVYEQLGGVSSGLALLMVVFFSAWLQNNRTNMVNPLWVAICWIGFMVPVVQRDNPNDFTKNEARQKLVQNSVDENEPKTPFDLSKIQGEWSVQKNESALAFVFKSEKGDTEGSFTDFNGTVTVKESSVVVSFEVITESIDTENTGRDKSLREDKGFFEVRQYPVMSFVSSSMVVVDTGYVSTGVYSLRGETKTIEIPFNVLGVDESNSYMILEGSTEVYPEDYGMEAATSLGEKVIINFSLYCIPK